MATSFLDRVLEEYQFVYVIECSNDYYGETRKDNGNYFINPTSPELGLIAAILNRTYLDISLISADRHIRKDAWEYVTDDARVEWSFYWCCEVLDIDYEMMKAKLLRVFADTSKQHLDNLSKFRKGYSFLVDTFQAQDEHILPKTEPLYKQSKPV